MKALPLLFTGIVLVGCGDEAMPVSDLSVSDVDMAPLVLDPHLFDCTSLSEFDGGTMPLPARASVVPIACALDPTCRTPQISGHRGTGGELGRIAPEDTLSAYRAAIALGIEFVETDPRPTADGVIVNMHDPAVDRTTDGTGSVDQLTFEQIRALHIKPGKLVGDYSCERVPTLAELLTTCRGRVVVLVDANKTDRVDLLVQAIHDADAVDWAIFDTDSLTKIDQALALEPRLHFMMRPDSIDKIATQIDHFLPRVPSLVELQATDRMAGAPIVHGRGTRVLSDVFDADLDAEFGSMTLAKYGQVLDDGVDVPQSDRPDLVLATLRQRGLR